MQQLIMFRFAATLAHNHPAMYDEFMHMSLEEIAEFLNDTYGVALRKGSSWEEVTVIDNIMQKFNQAKNKD